MLVSSKTLEKRVGIGGGGCAQLGSGGRRSVCTSPVLEDTGLVYQSSLTAIAKYHGWVAQTTHFNF